MISRISFTKNHISNVDKTSDCVIFRFVGLQKPCFNLCFGIRIATTWKWKTFPRFESHVKEGEAFDGLEVIHVLHFEILIAPCVADCINKRENLNLV